ncbi:MAG: hypothetical protein MUF31_12725 [Akkermansiaceae bacterium]|jgi:hypothetical protein|nr:hypothetical protein [Akkermansiaceae bacterium]
MREKKRQKLWKWPAALAIVLLLGGLGWALRDRSIETADSGETPVPEPSLGSESSLAREVVVIGEENEGLPAAVVSDPTIPHDHSHPGPCARCLAEKKLGPRRTEYAELQFQLISQSHQVSEDLAPALREACRDFANAVLIEWSFSENRPLLPPDDRVQEQWQKFLGPLVNPLPGIDSP